MFAKLKNNESKMTSGFTLAEILITIGIIGIVAAMTLPVLITKIRNRQTETTLKEDFSILNQMMLMANDNGGISSPTSINNQAYVKQWFDTYFLPYLKITEFCYGSSFERCWYNKYGCGGATISFTLHNGSSICMDDYGTVSLLDTYGVKTTSTYSYIFYIDTNGIKLPNQYGKDIFIAVFKEENANLVPAGDDMIEDDLLKNCSKRGNKYWCLSLIKRNGWKIQEIK